MPDGPADREETMPTVDVDGRTIGFEDSGGDGPAVLFLHGFLMDRSMFGPQVEDLAPEFRCISMDERGFGETPVDGPFTYWDLADDAVGLLDELGVERAAFAGMSRSPRRSPTSSSETLPS
jgi:pimeloyl-ACP methyl ester carboxylesterase